MKKTILISGILALSAIFYTGTSFAESSPVPTLYAEKNSDSALTDKLKSVNDMIQKRNLEIASTTKALMQKLVDKKADSQRINILKGYSNAYGQLTNLADRIQSRIAKMENDGTDVSASNILLTTAEADIALVKSDMQKFTDGLSATTSTSTRKTILTQLKSENSTLLKDVKTARADLIRAIESLKPTEQSSASTTSTTTEQ